MPKKSDRPQHESAMSNLLPEVALDEEESEETRPAADEESNSSTELQNSSNLEEQNYSDADPDSEASASGSASDAPRKEQSGEDDGDSVEPSRKNENRELSVLPNERPNLKKKLGPYVSEEIDDALEEAYLTLRRQFGGKASKSLIVEAALRYSLSDCLQRGEESEIASWMEEVLEDKG